MREPTPTREQALAPVNERWTCKKKEVVAQAIEAGVVSLYEAAAAHEVPATEVKGWCESYRRVGLDGLRSAAPGLKRPA